MSSAHCDTADGFAHILSSAPTGYVHTDTELTIKAHMSRSHGKKTNNVKDHTRISLPKSARSTEAYTPHGFQKSLGLGPVFMF